MSDERKYFDPAKRLRDKQRSRDQDDADLASGRRTAEEVQRTNSFAHGLDLVNATVRVHNTDAWDEPMPSETPAYRETVQRVIAAISDGFKAGLSHEAAAEILLDLAGEIERGDIVRDPWGPDDSRPLSCARRSRSANGGGSHGDTRSHVDTPDQRAAAG